MEWEKPKNSNGHPSISSLFFGDVGSQTGGARGLVQVQVCQVEHGHEDDEGVEDGESHFRNKKKEKCMFFDEKTKNKPSNEPLHIKVCFSKSSRVRELRMAGMELVRRR